MPDEPENLVLILLRRMDTKLDEMKVDLIELKERAGLLESQYASVSRRLDRMGGDIETIKRRLDLVDHE